MMNWEKLFWSLQGQEYAQAHVVSSAWLEAAQSGNSYLLSNLMNGCYGPVGICCALDAAGLGVRPEVLAALQGHLTGTLPPTRWVGSF